MTTSPTPPAELRTFPVTVESEHSRRHNELLRDVRRVQASAAILTGSGLCAAIIPLALYPNVWTMILAAVCILFALLWVYVAFRVPRSMGSMQTIYDTNELVPAIVVDVRDHGVTIMALVDAAYDRSAGRQPALALRDVASIDGRKPVTGDRLPAVAVTGLKRKRPTDNQYDLVSPAPLGWVTSDRGTIDRAMSAIPVEEWDRLRSLRHRWTDVRETPENLLVLV